MRWHHAVDIARRPEIGKSPYIRRLLDTHESDYSVRGVWEWADRTLLEELGGPVDLDDGLAEAVGANVGSALDTLHAIGLIHCDVAPNNILRVDGIWKLADLDNCVDEDDAVTGLPVAPYMPEGAHIGMPAARSLDRQELQLVVEHLKEVGWK